VGRMGMAAQPVQIGDQCSTGNVIHEIGHAVGLFHEHTRADRDSYVRLLRQNIQAEALVNFVIAPESATQGQYDFASIMHYGPYAFSVNGQPVLTTIPDGIAIGQRSGLSSGDVAAVRALYGEASPMAAAVGPGGSGAPSAVTVMLGSNPAGRTLVVDGEPLTAPTTLGWEIGSVHTVSAPSAATGDTIWTFARWSDGGGQTHTVRASAAVTSLTASFQTHYRLETEVQPAGAGLLRVSSGVASGFHAAGATVQVSAQANPNYCFVGWGGTIPVTAPAVALLLGRPYRVTAQFQVGAVTLPSTFSLPASGGSYEVGVAATSGCIWTAVTNGSWISIGTPFGVSAGVLRLTVRANTSGAARSALVVVNGRAMVVQQAAR
jgi:hypothetical protein